MSKPTCFSNVKTTARTPKLGDKMEIEHYASNFHTRFYVEGVSCFRPSSSHSEVEETISRPENTLSLFPLLLYIFLYITMDPSMNVFGGIYDDILLQDKPFSVDWSGTPMDMGITSSLLSVASSPDTPAPVVETENPNWTWDQIQSVSSM